MNYFEWLKKRGFVYQASDEGFVSKLLEKPENKSFYIGFDPTADSLHLGSMFALMTISRIARTGLRPIIILGGGTGLIGDPSGKTEMRNLLDEEQAKRNLSAIENQIRKIIPKDPEPLFLNNADWLKKINFIEFLRDVGKHFSINRMLTQDCVKNRLEEGGLSYLEFSYMLLQSYDYVHLNRLYDCVLQIGGADQWGNMVMGMDLARRVNKKDVHCFTFELMMTSSGEKMGKTAQGTVWLDEKKTSPYEYYQYWINIDDRDVKRFMNCYTYLEDDEIEEICNGDIRLAKQRLAFEATSILHGKDNAQKSVKASEALFSGSSGPLEGIPEFEIKVNLIEKGLNVLELFNMSGLCKSKSDAKRLVQGGGAYINDKKINSMDQLIDPSYIDRGMIMLRSGKKKYMKVIVK